MKQDVCPWTLRRRLNALMAPNARVTVSYDMRPLSAKSNEPMADIWMNGRHEWRVHRKVFGPESVDQPDPKWWQNPATGLKLVVRHDDAFFCDDCPPNKRGMIAPPIKAYCLPGQRLFSNMQRRDA